MLFVICCFFIVSTTWSIDKVLRGTIIKIDGNRLTIKDATGKETIFESKEAAQFKIGEMVKIESGRISKVGTLPQPLPRPEGIINKIDRNIFVLTPENDKTALLTIGAKTTLGLMVGDKVKTQNCELLKIGSLPQPIPRPATPAK